jgi:catechol 2,3-dioxygenase-like lactoylglutathione lyase family enzyme
MPIVGVETALYGVQDLEKSTKFFEDFGLPLLHKNEAESQFKMEEGSNVVLRHINDASIPASKYVGTGVKETIWGVDSEASLDRLANDLARDREVRRDGDGTAHFLSDCGMALGLRVFNRKKVVYAPDPLNAPGYINRLNQHRKWRKRALPKTLNHVVFGVTDYHATTKFSANGWAFVSAITRKAWAFTGAATEPTNITICSSLIARCPASAACRAFTIATSASKTLTN